MSDFDQGWYLDEGVLGQGVRPDYLEPKYKTVAEQAKAYKEARKALGAHSGAPDEYDLSQYKDQIDATNPHMKGFLDYAKANKLNQDSVSTIVKTLVDYENSFVPDEAKELEKLGANGAKKLETINQWAENTFSGKAKQTFSSIPKTAEVIEFMDEIRQIQHASRSNAPSSNQHGEPVKVLTEKDVRQEMHNNYKRYAEDPIYRKEIQNKLAQVLGSN